MWISRNWKVTETFQLHDLNVLLPNSEKHKKARSCVQQSWQVKNSPILKLCNINRGMIPYISDKTHQQE